MKKKPFLHFSSGAGFAAQGLILLAGLFLLGQQSVEQTPAGPAAGPVSVSEVMVLQHQTLADPDFGEYGSWIELHNSRRRSRDLGGWMLVVYPEDAWLSADGFLDDHVKHIEPLHQEVFPGGFTIAAGEYLLVWADGRDTIGTAYHAGFTLPVTGAVLALYRPASGGHRLSDILPYTAVDVAPDISLGRIYFDSHQDVGYLLPLNKPTPGAANRLAALKLKETHRVRIADPSGLSPDHTGRYLWSVSDRPGGGIYKLTTEGRIVKRLDVKGSDLEGVVQNPVDKTLWVVDETFWQIIQFDTLGQEKHRFELDVEHKRMNLGLEGIALDPVRNVIYAANEKNPRVIVEVDVSKPGESRQLRVIPVLFGANPDTRGLDLSGLHFDVEDELLWLVSDEARAVFVLDRDARPVAAFDAGQVRLEGIAIIRQKNTIFLINDDPQRLFLFEYPDPLLRLPASR